VTERTSGPRPDQETNGPPVSTDDVIDTNPNSPTAAGAAEETLDSVRAQRDEYYDLLLRKTAEFDNYRKRVERDRRELSEFAAADVLRAVLPLVDDLERALAAAPAAEEAATGAGSKDPRAAIAAYRAGVELIHKQLLDMLRKKGVTPIDSIGKDFDPHVHQAVTQEVSDAHREGEVMAELARGYKLGDRLLRPAMVKVATRG
jgi:molecular chaperone GrpE